MIRLLATLVACVLLTSIAEAKRVALVIGNGAYQHAAPLVNPRNDAEDMAQKLDELGFDVVSGVDLDFQGMRGTVRKFARKLDGADIALFFYAGHGLQVDGSNYMAPIDARLDSKVDLQFEAVPIDLVMSVMEQATDVNLVFLDACRDNPLARNLARSMGTRSGSVGRGLAKLGSGVGSLIAFATQPGNVALDGQGRNSPFTTALLEHLGTPGQDITRDLIYVRRSVLQATDGKQVPWDNSSLTGEVILKQKEEPAPQVAIPAEPDNTVELALWDSIKNGTSRSYFEIYLNRYPDGAFAEIAKLKIAEIERAEKTAAAQAEQDKQAENLRIQLDAERKAREEAEAARLAEQELREAEREAALREATEARKAAEAARLAVEKRLQELAAATRQAETQSAAETEIALLTPDAGSQEEPGIDWKDDRDLVRSIQQELNRLGCNVGGADGIWGGKSERGVRNFSRYGEVSLASLDPSPDLLKLLEGEQEKVCPLVCGANEEKKNGRCVAKAAPETRDANLSTTTRNNPAASNTQSRPSSGRVCYECQSWRSIRYDLKVCDTEQNMIKRVRNFKGCRKL